MSTDLIGVVGFGVLFALVFMGMPIAFAMLFVASVGFIVAVGFNEAMSVLATAPYSVMASYMKSTIPLFVLMGTVAFRSGLITDAYDMVRKWLASLSGGLAMATISAGAAFAACTGSSLASFSVMTATALPEMRQYKYDIKLATGSIAAAGSLGILIPPSIQMIVYGLFAEVSIGKLFIAGILPGLLLFSLYILTVYVWVKLRPSAGPRGPVVTWHEKLTSLKLGWPILLLGVLIIGGIWGGIFTPVEAGGFSAFVAFLIAFTRKRLTLQTIIGSIDDSIRISAMVLMILMGAVMLNYFLVVTGLPSTVASYILALPVSPVVLMIIIICFYLVMGCLMDASGLILISLPIFIPVMNGLGIDLVLFGIFLVLMVEIASVTPPIGLGVFVISGMARDVPMYTVFRGIVPFLLPMMVCVVLVLAFPQIALFLPNIMLG